MFDLALVATDMSNAYGSNSDITKPGSVKFMQGWSHIVTAFLIIAEHSDRSGIRFPSVAAQDHLEHAYNSIMDGDKLVTKNLRTADVKDLEILSTNDIAAMLLYGLTTHAARNHLDVCSMYREYSQRVVGTLFSHWLGAFC